MRADEPPPRMPEARPALLAVRAGPTVDPAWLEEEVDGWALPAELDADVLWRAIVARRVLRPDAADPQDRLWLEAVRAWCGAQAAAKVVDAGALVVGEADGLDAVWACRPLVARASRSTVALPSAEALRVRFGLAQIPADAILGLPLGSRSSDGALLLISRGGGPEWLETALPLARAAADAAERVALIRRATGAETDLRQLHQAMTRFVQMVSHDLRSPLFAVQLGVKVLERQNGPSQSITVLNRAVGSASDLLKRLVEAGRSVLDPPRVAPGTSDLGAGWARVASEVAAQHPGATIVGRVGSPGNVPLRVALDATSVEMLLRVLLTNAVVHGGTDAPVQVETTVGDTDVVVRIRNRGRLPFADLAALEPFEQRANGGLGVGLFLARRVALAGGVDLDVADASGEVEARLRIRRV
jgi:signal transduction histidine kinase